MSLSLFYGGGTVPEQGEFDWFTVLSQVLAYAGMAPHREPEVALQAWSVKRRVLPLVDAIERSAGAYPVLEACALDNAAFVPVDFAGVLTGAHGLCVASQPRLVAELTGLASTLSGLGLDEAHPEVDAVQTFLFAASQATRAQAVLWLR